jgi:hypothetical protein
MLYILFRIWSALADPTTLFPCDASTDKADRIAWTRGQRQGARELALEHLKAKGTSRTFRVFVDIATIRESSGAPSRQHDDGNGMGLHGLNVRLHARGRNLCDPRQSAEAVRDLARRCITRYGVTTLWGLQSCYGGRLGCTPRGPGKCTQGMMERTDKALTCRPNDKGESIKTRYGITCEHPISLKDLG